MLIPAKPFGCFVALRSLSYFFLLLPLLRQLLCPLKNFIHYILVTLQIAYSQLCSLLPQYDAVSWVNCPHTYSRHISLQANSSFHFPSATLRRNSSQYFFSPSAVNNLACLAACPQLRVCHIFSSRHKSIRIKNSPNPCV